MFCNKEQYKKYQKKSGYWKKDSTACKYIRVHLDPIQLGVLTHAKQSNEMRLEFKTNIKKYFINLTCCYQIITWAFFFGIRDFIH